MEHFGAMGQHRRSADHRRRRPGGFTFLGGIAATAILLAGCGLGAGSERGSQAALIDPGATTATPTATPTATQPGTIDGPTATATATATAPRAATSRPVAASTTKAAPSATPATKRPRTTAVPRPRASGPRPTATPGPTPGGSGTESASEAEVVRLVNAQRSSHGCVALRVDATLVLLARAHSKDMAVNGYFDHTSRDGRSPFQRMTDAGYRYSLAAENIAGGQPTAASVMDTWLSSPGHRANILDCDLREIGVGVYKLSGSPRRIYWTQDFGTRR
jgi:uncharacterized protein YkwD